MDLKTRRAREVATLLAFGIMVSALAFLFFGPTALGQRRRLSQIQAHQAILAPRLAADRRFEQVKLGAATTNSSGVLLVQGIVETEAERTALKDLIASTNPPCHVDYRVVLRK